VATALVTGASGFVGWHVARTLVERGCKVRALCRPASRLRELDAERIEGDLRDPESLAKAVAGCSLVFHVAADYRLWTRHPQELYDSNVKGTRNLLEAAFQAGADRVVYTSTVGCIGMPQGHEGDENSSVSIGDMAGHYKRSKWLAEQEALEKAAAGFPVIIVNPTAPVGDHDWKPTPTGKIIVDFLRDRLPAFVDTGLNVVDVRDVAVGHVLAAEHGRPGHRYILTDRSS
jgi:dihydroflavonol-4-reductase